MTALVLPPCARRACVLAGVAVAVSGCASLGYAPPKAPCKFSASTAVDPCGTETPLNLDLRSPSDVLPGGKGDTTSVERSLA